MRARMLLKILTVIKERAPALILVHEDTTSSIAAPLADFCVGILIGHIKAGFRTGD
jgi:UDP-N-acetylglucosamine 2-epimerase (non-hydrolysing)